MKNFRQVEIAYWKKQQNNKQSMLKIKTDSFDEVRFISLFENLNY